MESVGMTHYTRSMMGVLTVGICAFAGLSLWPSKPIIAGILGLMATYRLVMIVREWPRSED